MNRPNTPAYTTLNWPAYDEALKRRGSLTIWFDPDIAWAAKPTGFFESLPGLIGLDWEVPDFSTLSRRRKALAVTSPIGARRGRCTS